MPLQNGLPHWFFAGYGGAALADADLAAVDPHGRLRRGLPPSQCVGAVGFVAGSTVDAPDGTRAWHSNWPPERSTVTLGDATPAAAGHSAAMRASDVAALVPPREWQPIGL